MFTVTIQTNTSAITRSYSQRVLLSKALNDAGFLMDMPCGGKGICGKCEVEVSGELNGAYLACQTYAAGDITIYYTPDTSEIQGITDGRQTEFAKNPLTGDKDCYGLAIDIGTTTIAGYLYKLPECECVSATCVANSQSKFGADVISRIEYSMNGGIKELQSSVHTDIEAIKSKFAKRIDISVITANTVMLHLLTGLDSSGIAVAPFTPKSLFGRLENDTYLVSCISSYVGADITCGILASGMMKDRASLLVDIGTNGEMALNYNGRLICCSTAAGPAFEGAGISRGCLAKTGAIDKVMVKDKQIHFSTIDNASPIGVCGTGLIDAVACMMKTDLIDETGYLEEPFEIGSSGVCITTEDIRQVQLAKSAVRSGMDTLMAHCDISYKDIDKVYIAGGFGSYIDKDNAALIGLIPTEVVDRVEVLGNAAGLGAGMILQSREYLKKSEEIAKAAEVIELSASPIFMEKYIENMYF